MYIYSQLYEDECYLMSESAVVFASRILESFSCLASKFRVGRDRYVK